MALSGPEKEIRMQQGSYPLLPEPSETLDHHKPRASQPDHQFPGASAILPISVGSKLKSHRGGVSTRYRECLKNHAANIGGNVTDGCGEFMPSGEDGTLEALKCAACNCHRNFHRKEATAADSNFSTVHPLHLPPPPSMNHHRTIHWNSMISPVKMAFGGGSTAGTDSSSEELNFNAGAPAPPLPYGLSKKRFRTKFTQEQKDKMMEFAEKVGWRIPREDDAEVQRFCGEIGVKRQVLKVWMHNNKNSAKKQLDDTNGDWWIR